MLDRPSAHLWRPKPFSVAIVDSDEFLGDTLCKLLNDGGCAATVYYDAAAFLATHGAGGFDAYVLDFAAGWPREGDALEKLVAGLRAGERGEKPVFILGSHAAPEQVDGLAPVLMRHKVRYILRPVRAAYVAQQVGEALARAAGI